MKRALQRTAGAPCIPGRRRLLALLVGAITAPRAASGAAADSPRTGPFPAVVPGYRLRFPEDEGSHPAFRVEWWYITGWLEARQPLGFQATFFRVRPAMKQDNPSRLAPRQILIAHAALSDPALGRLSHAQRAARAVFELAGAETGRTKVWLDDWSLIQEGRVYRCRVPAPAASLDLTLEATQPPILQGDDGFSRKGPRPESASYYYSLPHLRVQGTVAREGRALEVSGSAWLDHEWSSEYLEEAAAGWDWIGLNLRRGAALMAFRMRGREGGVRWAGGTLREGASRVAFAPGEVAFEPLRHWVSPRTGTRYPVAWRVRAGRLTFDLEPLFDDQEHDARPTTGTVYWEGAVRAMAGGAEIGRGYLELTGYWQRVPV